MTDRPRIHYLLSLPSTPRLAQQSYHISLGLFSGNWEECSWLSKQHKATPLGHQIACNKCEQVNFVACSQRQRQRVPTARHVPSTARSSEKVHPISSQTPSKSTINWGIVRGRLDSVCLTNTLNVKAATAGMPPVSPAPAPAPSCSFLLSGPILMIIINYRLDGTAMQ